MNKPIVADKFLNGSMQKYDPKRARKIDDESRIERKRR